MATQKCPKCTSRRVRLGYQPTRWFMKIAFRYNLLCDNCNWEFRGFAIPGTVRRKTRKRRNTGEVPPPQQPGAGETESLNRSKKIMNETDQIGGAGKKSEGESIQKKVKRRVRVRLH